MIAAMRAGGEDRPSVVKYLSAASIGIEMGAALVVGMAIGWYLDKWFGTKPWLLVIFTGFGIAAGFRNLIVAARKAMTADKRQ